MSNFRIPIKFLTRVGDGGGRSPSRPVVSLHVNLESLEGRALLSHVPAAVAPIYQGPKHPHPGPIKNEFGVGFAVKSPRFYEYYTGPLQANINAAGMKATYDASGNLILTGIVAGPNNAMASGPQPDAHYMFLINHGGTTGTGPFPDRPNIQYDAYVAVNVTSTGVSAAVVDGVTGTITPISPSGIVIQGSLPQGGQADDFKVYVPAGTPGIAPSASGNPTVAFVGLDADPLASPFSTPDPSTIASFAPEGREVLIAGGAGMAPKPHLT